MNEASGKPEPPTVVNVRRHAYDEYIGRATWRSFATRTAFAKSSVYANPYRIGVDGNRKAVLVKYEKLWRRRLRGARRPLWVGRLRMLAGKALGCWCNPLPCHGDVLVKLFREVFSGDNDGRDDNAAGV